MTKKMARIAAAAGAAALLSSLATTAASAAPARPAAPRTVCHAWEEVQHSYPLEPRYRVAAECTSLSPASKARGVLDLTGRPDAHTSWFTSTGVVHYSHWATPLLGVRGVRMEYAPR
jgi:hypothetical protein